MTGVTPQRFSADLGMKWKDLLYYANRETSRTSSDAGAMIYDNLMALLNERLGQIMGLRIELERRESKSRERRTALYARDARRGQR